MRHPVHDISHFAPKYLLGGCRSNVLQRKLYHKTMMPSLYHCYGSIWVTEDFNRSVYIGMQPTYKYLFHVIAFELGICLKLDVF